MSGPTVINAFDREGGFHICFFEFEDFSLEAFRDILDDFTAVVSEDDWFAFFIEEVDC